MAELITPALICAVVIAAVLKKQPLYKALTEGAEEGLGIIMKITPPIIMIMAAVGALTESGALDFIVKCISPVTERLGIPAELIPLAVIRPMSGSGALGMLSANLREYGADTELGRMSSVIMGSTETTFYVLAVYFSGTSVKNPARAVLCAVISDIAGIILGVMFVRMF